MRQGHLELPNFSGTVYGIQEKSGGRTEYALELTNDLQEYAAQISERPLRFASLMLASPGDEDQKYHADSAQGERAIVYLSDVDDSKGPIDFQREGPIVGPAGTFAHYDASEIHRGLSSQSDRWALTLAFDTSNTIITTVGTGPSPSSGDDKFKIFIVVVVALIVAYMVYRYYRK